MSVPSSQQGTALSEDLGSSAAADDLRGPLRMVIASAVALVVLIGAYFLVDDEDDTTTTAQDPSAEFLAAGLSAYNQRDYQTARKAFHDAIAHDRRNYVAHYNLGLIMHVVDGNPAGAESAYRTALKFKPDFAAALFNLGVIRAGAGARDEAKAFYRRAIAADPQLASAHFNLGYLLYEDDPSSPEARALFDRAKALQPDLADRIPADLTTTTAPGSSAPDTAAP